MIKWLIILAVPVWCSSCATAPDTAYLNDPLLRPAPVLAVAPAPPAPPVQPVTKVFYPPLPGAELPAPVRLPVNSAVAANDAAATTPATPPEAKARHTHRRDRNAYYGGGVGKAAVPPTTTTANTPRKNAKPRST